LLTELLCPIIRACDSLYAKHYYVQRYRKREDMDTLTIVLTVAGIGLLCAFCFIIWSYARGLRNSPRELWILFLTKVIEYTAYGAMNMSFVLYLSADCGLGDISAGSYIGVWSMLVTITTMLVGAVVDAIGIKKTLIIGTLVLIFSRGFMPFLSNVYAVTLLGFIPMAVGIAIMGPVLSVGIKRYTTKEGAALGFGLFYTLMNVGWALGAVLFDGVRGVFGEHSMVSTPLIGVQLSTYQIIFMAGFLLTIPTLVMVLIMRDGVEMTETGTYRIAPLKNDFVGSIVSVFWQVFKKAALDTGRILSQVVRQKEFWYYMFMLGILVFVRLVFYHFHYTFPKYGIRILGEGVKIGNIYGVLNPTIIVFLVPLVAAVSRRVSSYKMLMLGTTISASAIFIATMPESFFSPLMGTWVEELVYNRWLGLAPEMHTPLVLALVIFVILFTVGESIWSPRLMQFAAEIAPAGREGTYIALSYLPYFAAKLVAGPLSGWLLFTYVPEGAGSYPHHYFVWLWIGGMAVLSPIGLAVFRGVFMSSERRRREEEALKKAEAGN